MENVKPKELIFCNTFFHDEKEEVQLDLIKFPYPVDIQELRVVPRGKWAHMDLKEDTHFGQTTPSTLKVDFFFKSSKNGSSAIYQKMGNLDYVEKGHIQLFPKTKVTTDCVVVRGRYHKLTLCVYGGISSQSDSSPSPSPPPPPPPPPPPVKVKDQPKESQQGVEEISQIETIKSSSRPPNWEWEGPKATRLENPHFPDFSESGAESLAQKPVEPVHAPVRRGPRTPSPPPPPPSDQWDSQQPRKHWSEGEEVSPEEWQTQDLWVEGQPTEPPPDEESDCAWETTDSWTPQDGGDWEDSERGEREQGDRRRKGPRTPPGEPRSPKSYDSKRKRRRPREEETVENMDERKRRRRIPDEIFEPLSPARSIDSFPHDSCHDDQEDEEGMVEAYEEISDEEALEEDVGFLENMDIDSLDTGADVTPFDPFQAELEPLKVLGSFENFVKGKKMFSLECIAPEESPEERKKVKDILEELKAEDRGPKWVAALEEISNLLTYEPLSEEELNKICDWTVEALNYTIAQKQPIAVNIRQLKAGMKLTSSLCNLGESVATKLVDKDVVSKLLSLLFEDHMATSLKLLIFKALDSSTNWQVGLDRFLAASEDNGYRKLLKFLLTEQTVRVVHAGSALLQKIHFYETLGSLKDTVEKVLAATPLTPVKDVEPSIPGDGSQPPSSLDERSPDIPDSKGHPLEPHFTSLDEELMKKLQACLEEVHSVMRTDAYNMLQPSANFFPTTAAPSKDDAEGVWQTVYHMFAKRDLLSSLTLVLCCPSSACNLSLVTTIREIISMIAQSFQGMLLLASQPEVVKTLFQAMTSSDDEDTDDFSLQQLGMEIMHKMAGLQVLDSLVQKVFDDKIHEHRENVEVLELFEQGFALTFNPIGRQALADVFSKGDHLKYLLCLLRTKEIGADDPQPKKNAIDGYLRHLLWVVLQYSEDINLLKRHSEALKNQTAEKDIHKWVTPLKSGQFDSTMVGSLVEYIQGCCDDLATDFSNISPGILTSLRVLKYLTCMPESKKTGGQQKNLSYQLATLEMFSSGGIPVLCSCIKKVSDFLLRPWQMGHCLTSKQQHIAENISLLALKMLKAILTEVFSTGKVEFKDDRPISSVVALYTVMCCAPPGVTLGRNPQEIHQDILDILLTYTTAPSVMPDSTQALSQGCWNIMLKVILEYIPTGLYTFLGGLSLLSDLLPLPLPLQTQESLSQEEISQILHLRKIWSIHILCQSGPIQSIIAQLLYTSSPVLQHMLRRVLCQLADLSAPTATMVIRSVLEAIVCKLDFTSSSMEPSTVEVAQALSLFVYLVSQPSIKAAFLHIVSSSPGSDGPLDDILRRLLTLMNVPSGSPAHLQAQECVVASLQSLCSPEIMLLSDERMLEHLANSLPGKEDMNLICTYLLDHVTSPDHSYASILPALRMTATLLDHDYGFTNVKGALLRHQGTFSGFYKRLTDAFTRDSSDYLSTLSTAVDLLHFLINVETYQEDDQADAVRYRTQALTIKDLRQLIAWESEKHPLKQLEKILVECCKEDEKLETLLDSLSSLLQVLDDEDPPDKPPETQDQDLPPVRSLADQFTGRMVFYISEEEDDRLVPGIWIGLPPIDEMDAVPEMIMCDLEEIRCKFFPDFNLKEELDKGFLTEDRLEKPKLRKTRRYTALTSKGRGQFFNTVRRAHNAGFRGGKRTYDIFRQRAQNTSRPPSMHVDDFMNFENSPSSGDNQYRNQPQRRGIGIPRGPRGSRGGFRPWSGPSFRRDNGPPRGMPQRGRGQWGPGRKPMRSNYHQGPPDRNYMQRRPDPRSEGRPPRSPMGPQPYNRPGSAERVRGPYRGMRGMGPRGTPSPRRGSRGYRGGHWTGDPHMRPQGKGMRGRPPPPGRHSRSFTR